MSKSTDERLSAALRDLPQRQTGADFTERVMNRIDGHRERRRQRFLFAAAAAAVGIAAVGGFAMMGGFSGPRSFSETVAGGQAVIEEAPAPLELAGSSDQAQSLRELLERSNQMQDDLRTIRVEFDEDPSLVYLGSDEQNEYFVDLKHAAGAMPAGMRVDGERRGRGQR